MIGQRLRQFRDATREPSADDHALAERLLDAELRRLFLAQTPRDMAHSAGTARWLIERGHDDHDLLVAALLHDVGKGEQRRTDRALWVVADSAHIARLLANDRSPLAFRRALARTATHSETSAEAMREAGASALAVGLTLRHHTEAGADRMLALLQQADAAN